jgi:hypothetical protein
MLVRGYKVYNTPYANVYTLAKKYEAIQTLTPSKSGCRLYWSPLLFNCREETRLQAIIPLKQEVRGIVSQNLLIMMAHKYTSLP